MGKNIEAFYPLSPMQQGMLFHTFLAPESGIYFQQWNCKLHGKLDAGVLQQAWQEVVNRHSVLRTFFVWQDLKEPVQIVRQHVVLPWVSLDWRALDPTVQEEQLAEFLAADLASGFDLQQAPLMRLALIRIENETYHFVWSFHHLLLDGWSTPLVIKEVFTFYEGISQGRRVELGAARPYRDYIRWLRTQELGAAERFWREMLKGFSAPTALGIERRASAVEEERYEGQEVQLTAEATAELQQFARSHQVTLNTVVQGAWALLLSRYSGSEDVVFGATVSGRPASLAGVEEMVGMFINTLPVRVQMKTDEQVGGYLRRLQEQQVEVRQYEYSPLVEVQGWSEVGRGVRLFDTIFVFENTPLEETQSEIYGGLWFSEVSYIERNNYSLTVVVVPGRNLSLQVWCDGRNYDAATTRRLLEHLRTLLGAIVANPKKALGELWLLTEAERRHVLLEWNETDAAYPLSSCIHQLFEAQVRRSPEAIAARSASASLTFAELDQRANQLAHYLLDSGIGPQSVVALLLDHSCETLIAILGVLKAGCAYLPLDPSHPPARMAFALTDADAALLITTHSLAERLAAGLTAHLSTSMPPVMSLDRDWQRCATLPDTAPLLLSLSSSTAAYLIYTSGSTGTPKGVVVEHASLVNYICWAQSVYLRDGTAGDCALYSSLAFDLTVTSLFLPLVSGHTVHLYPQQDVGPSLLEVMEDNRCQVLKLTPSHLALIQDLDNRDSRIRCLIVGGEALSTELAQAVSESFDHQVEIYNEYGPTEATVGCMIYRFDPEREERVWVPIGRPAANTQIYILDQRLEPTAEQVTGELYIGGAGVARGYLNRAELTAARFVPDPFSGRAGGRLYRTGDRARRLADGNIEYLGRGDEQVKYHGYRVELNELRLALSAHAKVRDAVVVLRKDGAGGREQLVGYYVGREAIAAEELRWHMQERVIAETVPQWFVHLRRLPLTLNGKVNVEALPAPWAENGAGGGKEGSGEPRTEAEARLVAIWREVLGREQVRIDDNFFELGGDSILSIQIIARANRAGLQLMPYQLFQHPTVAGLAAVAGTAQGTVSEQGEVSGEAPLTPIQRWFFEQELAVPAHYNQSLLLQTRQPLQEEALKAAVRGLLSQHDALRLRFERGSDGEWRQWHAPLSDELVAQSCTTIDLSNVADEELGAAITTAAEEVQRSLDLQRGPLLRVLLMETGAGRVERLLVVAHHLVVDGVSWRVLLEDLERAYEQAASGAAVELGAKTSSYRAWAEALVAEEERGLAAEEVRYWTELADAQVAQIAEGNMQGGGSVAERGLGAEEVRYWAGELITQTEQAGAEVRQIAEGNTDGGTVGSAARVEVVLSAERTQQLLQQVPAAYNTQINDVLLAALLLAFTRWNGSRELLIDLEGHGREDVGDGVDVSRTVGWFTSIYPVRLETTWASGELGSLLKETKESLRRIPRRGIGYGLLRYLSAETELAKQLRALPHPPISFNYLGQLSQTIDASSLFEPASEFGGAEVDQRTRRPHLLDVNASIIDDQLKAHWTYNTNVHERSEIELLAKSFVAALEELVEHCLAPDAGGYTPSDFPLVRIKQQQLDKLLPGQKVDDIYPLSSMQEGILFHSIYDPELREYCIQINCTFHGALNEPALKRAWEEVVKRHSVLRTFFVWQDLQEPVQVVRQHVSLPWLSLDWRDLAPALQQEQLTEFLATDLASGFDLQQAPLMRLALIRVADETHHFVWSFHHLLLDGWSTPLVIKQVFTFYEGLSQERAVQLGAVRPYREYISWLRTQERGAAEQFWRELLKGFSAPTMLGIELRIETQRRSEDTQQRYVEQQVKLTTQATQELQRLARTNQVTLNTVVQGAWALLLSRYSGSEDVVFGTTVSGRPASLAGVEEMVGLFINTLPMRVQLKSEEGVGGYLRRLQEQQVEVQHYEYSPLVDVQKWCEVPKGTPLFESLLVFQNYPVGEALEQRSGGLEVRDVKSVESNNYPLSLIITPGRELILSFVHNSERYETESIERMMGHLEVVLREMAGKSTQKLSSISMLTDVELDQFLFEWNGNRSEFLQEDCLHQLFEAQVELSPKSVAAIYEEQSLTYDELNLRANQLAHYLQKLGVGPEVMVALCLERSLEMIVAQLAVLKAGGAYVPLDPSYPTARLTWMCEDTNATILLTQDSVLTTVPATCTRVIRLDSEWEAIAAESELNPVSTVVGGNAAYVIYTSGSTGKSKGVVVTHANVLRLFAATRSWANFDEHDVWTLFHSYAFDFSVWELWGALLHGGRLVVVSYWVSRSPEAFHRLLAEAQVTILNQTPSAFRQLMLLEETFSLSEQLNLRLIIFGGEALELQSLEPWFASHAEQPVQLVNMYGITETTVHVTHHTVTKHELAARGGSVIGVPISDLQVYLLDRHLFPVPLGVVGEIYVGGPGVARGYLCQPALTAERFIPHPFSQKTGERLYRSGDLGRYLADGEIEYVGRIDSQVKIRGFRVELAEIEKTLEQLPGVAQATVIDREYAPGDRRLIAYLVPDQKSALPVAQWQHLQAAGQLDGHLRHELPNGMTIVHLNNSETNFLYREIFDEGVYLKHGITLKPGDCVFDVGSNIGLFALFIANHCKDAQLYCFEPIPPIFDLLRVNTFLYGVDAKLFQYGLGSTEGLATFSFYPHASILSGRFADAEQEHETVKTYLRAQPEFDLNEEVSDAKLDELLDERLTVEQVSCPMKTLSEVIRENGVEHIALLKVDVEKSELNVLGGIDEADWEKIQQLVIEVHDIDDNLQKITRLLERHGYQLTVEQDMVLKDVALYNVYAIRPRPVKVPVNGDAWKPAWRWTSGEQLIGSVREHLREKLPEYMVPSQMVLLNSFPLTPNGKIDRKALPGLNGKLDPQALPAPDGSKLDGSYIPPRTQREILLVQIWSEVLGVKHIGINDNFFELGGDSILSIKIIARANRAGLQLLPRQLFQYPTVAGLAAVAGTVAGTVSEQGEVRGEAPLTPIQRWFFEQELTVPAHYNQSLLLQTRRPLKEVALKAAVRGLLSQHDALRLRFERGSDGEWRQWHAAMSEELVEQSCTSINLSPVASEELGTAIAAAAEEVQRSLNLEHGPLLRVMWIETGRVGRLLLVAHHLVVDGVSWRVLLEDLERAYEQAARGAAVELGPKTSSYRAWAEALVAEAERGLGGDEVRYWTEVAGTPVVEIPGAGEGGGAERNARRVEVGLSAEQTQQLLQEVPAAYNTQINDVLVTALARTLSWWTTRAHHSENGASAAVLVEMEGHGREEVSERVDVSRTVGWFTSIYPVVLESKAAEEVGAALKRVKEQLRAVPRRGLGFGLLRYLGSGETTTRLRTMRRAQVGFNYLGQLDQMVGEDRWLTLGEESAGPERDASAQRVHAIEVNGYVVGGELRIGWSYDAERYEREEMEAVAERYGQELEELIAHCVSEETGGFTPSDFPLAEAEESDLEKAFAAVEFEERA